MQATDTIACRGIDFCNFIRLCIWSDILQCPNSEAHGILQLSMLTKSSYPECSRRNYDWSKKFQVCIRQDIAGEMMVAQLELKLLRFRHGFALALVSWYSHDTSQNIPYWRRHSFRRGKHNQWSCSQEPDSEQVGFLMRFPDGVRTYQRHLAPETHSISHASHRLVHAANSQPNICRPHLALQNTGVIELLFPKALVSIVADSCSFSVVSRSRLPSWSCKFYCRPQCARYGSRNPSNHSSRSGRLIQE